MLTGDEAVALALDTLATAGASKGDAAKGIVEFARARNAQLVVVGARRRRLAPSVSRRVIGASGQAVVVAAPVSAAA